MNAIESLIRDLHSRGIVFEPRGDVLVVSPAEKIEPAEAEALRERQQEILSLFRSGRFRLVECPGDDCREVLFVVDGLAHCDRHGMSVRFSTSVEFAASAAAPIARAAIAR